MESRMLKFRVSFRVNEPRLGHYRSEEFEFPSFAKARRNYKSLVLQMYRARHLKKWEVCLNRTSNPEWKYPIFYESGTPLQMQ